VLGGAIAVVLALAVTWIGLGIAYYSPYPIGFWVTTLAFGAYLVAGVVTRRNPWSKRTLGTAT
jgi:zinc/manganese transport system permease protein